jgi:NitT/TauT family transport system substrate-binding protein
MKSGQRFSRARSFGAAIHFAAIMVLCFLGRSEIHAQGPVKVPFPYSPVNASSLHWMIAKDTKIFDKYRLDVDMIYMGASSLILQSMLSGSANLAGLAGPVIISNVLRGGDVIIVAATTPLTISVMARATIEKGEDLRGKKIGISRLGAVPHFAIQLILQRFGVKDAVILQVGGQPEAAAALRRGAIDAAVLGLPHTHLLQKDGFRELVGHQDYVKLGIKFVSSGVAVRRSYASRNRDVVVRFIKATLEGIKTMTMQESLAKQVFARYSRQSDPQVLDQIYKFALETVSKDPTIPKEAIVSMARLMGELGLVDRSAAMSTPAEAYYDDSYVEEIKQSGFLQELWK